MGYSATLVLTAISISLCACHLNDDKKDQVDSRRIIFIVGALSVFGILALLVALLYFWLSDRRTRRREKRLQQRQWVVRQ